MGNRTYFWAIRAGKYYNLTDGLQWLSGISGEGLPPIRRITESGPTQNGVTDLGFRLSARALNIALSIPQYAECDGRAFRQKFLDVFKPGNDIITLRWDYSDGTSRAIDVLTTGGLNFGMDAIRPAAGGLVLRDVVQVYAPSVTWYDPTQQIESWSSVSDQLCYPICYPIVYGTGVISDIKTLDYSGTWLEYPIIVITGPMATLEITNQSTGEWMELVYTLSTGQSVTIDLRFGYKTVKLQDGTNLIAYIVNGSDLADFHLGADPEVANGQNEIQVSMAGCVAGYSSLQIQYYERYIGV